MKAQQVACERAVRAHQLREASAPAPLNPELLIASGAVEPPRAGRVRRFFRALVAFLAAPRCDLT